jgi:integrase
MEKKWVGSFAEQSSIRVLSDALQWVDQSSLGEVEKRDIRSAVETACRWFKMTPHEVPADPVALRRLFRSVPAGAVSRTKKRKANVKWGVGRLLRLVGVVPRREKNDPLTPCWRGLIDAVSDKYARDFLRRFAGYCCLRHIEPEGVSDGLTTEFLGSLEQQLRVADPRRSHRETIRLWNRAVASYPSWPQRLLSLPSYSRKYVLSWSAFPSSLIEDVECFIAKQATSDPFDLSTPIRPLKRSSIETYRDRLRRFASSLVLTGTDPAELQTLSDLVHHEAVERGLRYLAQSRGRKPLAGVVGAVLVKIARQYLGRTGEEVAAISGIARRLRGSTRNLSAKVRKRLAPLRHECNLARLFLLPTGLIRSLTRKRNPTLRDAQNFQRALALALLTVCPLRIGSLCALRMDRHFNWSGSSMKGNLIIEFNEGELKGNEPASFPIPGDVAGLIRIYWERFRPLQDPQGSPFLFCGRDPSRPRAKSTFSTLLTRLVFEKTGLSVNPHLYRHIVHLVVLRKFPGAYALIARVLAHRSITTTIQNYSHYDGELAMAAYQRLVLGVQVSSPSAGEPDLATIAYGLDREGGIHGGRR